MTMTHTFKQFFTPSKYSQVMIDSLEIKSPKKIIDLAMGEGSLLIEAMKRWEDSSYFGNDIDPNCCQNIPCEHSELKCYNFDIFLNTTISTLLQEVGKVDLCIGNPPFHLIQKSSDIKKILKDFKLDKVYNSNFIPSEIPFILQCIKILNTNGTLAIILPDGFFTNTSLSYFREFLITNYTVEKVIELPGKIFKKTDAKTHIIFLKNTKPKTSQLTLSCMGHHEKINITFSQAVKRMDYSHYYNFNSFMNGKILSDLNVNLFRGKSKCLINNIDNKYILHTTGFSDNTFFKNRLKTDKSLLSYKDHIVIPGDIVFARVGTNVVGKVGIIQKGYFVATDCIFVIRASNEILQAHIYNSLTSDYGQQWIQAHLKGVAAKHITLTDMKYFPICEDINE